VDLPIGWHPIERRGDAVQVWAETMSLVAACDREPEGDLTDRWGDERLSDE
jgi:hypothetical protein